MNAWSGFCANWLDRFKTTAHCLYTKTKRIVFEKWNVAPFIAIHDSDKQHTNKIMNAHGFDCFLFRFLHMCISKKNLQKKNQLFSRSAHWMSRLSNCQSTRWATVIIVSSDVHLEYKYNVTLASTKSIQFPASFRKQLRIAFGIVWRCALIENSNQQFDEILRYFSKSNHFLGYSWTNFTLLTYTLNQYYWSEWLRRCEEYFKQMKQMDDE